MTTEEARTKMQDAVSHLKEEIAQIRTGRANSALVSDIHVDAYDSKLMVKELGQITTPEPTVIIISPWDKSVLTNIVGGITNANVGLTPVIDGEVVRIVIPALTTERREQFIKKMHDIVENFKVEIRQIRHNFLETLKSSDKSEDDQERDKHEIQKLHDQYIEIIEIAGKNKEERLRQV